MDFRSEMLAARVRRFRQQSKMSIEQLAKSAGVDKNTIVRLEKGEGRPNLSTLMSICGVFKVSADDLMNMQSRANEDYFVFRKGEKCFNESKDGLEILDLNASLPNGLMNAVVLEISGEGMTRSHPGEELVFCLKGKVGLSLGNTTLELNKGDSVMFYGREPHRYFCPDESEDAEKGLILCVWLDKDAGESFYFFDDYKIIGKDPTPE
jgi:XRE family transcriptional regulator, regulator of sulfur utilization